MKLDPQSWTCPKCQKAIPWSNFGICPYCDWDASFTAAREQSMPNKLDREARTKQEHCYTCGKLFERVKYECRICGEWQCSEECRQKHIETMDAI